MLETFKSAGRVPPASKTADSDALRGPQRIVLLCDGTWQTRRLVQTVNEGGAPTSSSDKYYTNVALLSQAIASSSSARRPDGTVMPQIVAYQSGIGASVDLVSMLVQGATGLTLGQKVSEAYGFLVDNYQPGDEVLLFGFSRGAYTARTIAGFINFAGVLGKRTFANGFMDIWKAYMARDPSDAKTEDYAERVFYEKTGLWPSGNAMRTARGNEEAAVEMMGKDPAEEEKEQDKEVDEKRKYPRVYPPQIKVVGVWDTVGALGIPGHFLSPSLSRFFSFFDPVLAPNVSYAFQALALCEDRKDFAPTLFFQPPPGAEVPSDEARRKGQILKQVWFQGSHSDVGGGHAWHGLSDITLAWMVSQLVDQPGGPLLDINLDALVQLQDRRRAWARQPEHPSRVCIEFQETRQVGQWALLAQNKDKNPTTVTGKKLPVLPWWWTNVVKSSGTTNEEIHYSVHIGQRYTKQDSPQLDDLRKAAINAKDGQPSQLDVIWEHNRLPASLGPTELRLRWKDGDPKSPVDSQYLGADDPEVGDQELDEDLQHTGEQDDGDGGGVDDEAPLPKPKGWSDAAWNLALGIAEAPVRTIAFIVNLGPTPNRNLKPGLLVTAIQKIRKWASKNKKGKKSKKAAPPPTM